MVRRKNRPVDATALPGYRDVGEIGGGAFATVYRATETDTGRHVALKILKVDTIHPHLMETFAQEIQALAQVSDHPNIVTLYRPLATPDGRPVLVLELCRESLAARVRRTGPIGAPEVTRIGIKIAGALETAHRHGFLHRDLKPQNILVTQFGEPALSDFGIAALQASAQATAGVFGFTTLHAAPEILEGNHLSPATDIYSLASTMYQLLSGLAPFATFDNEAPASVILRIIRDPVRPLRADDIPIGLADLLEAALSKDPDDRPHSAFEFAEALVVLETAAGWTPTSYVVWGADRAAVAHPAPSPAAPPAPPAEVVRAPLYASAPSVTRPEVAVERPVLAPPDPLSGPLPPPPPASPLRPSVAPPLTAGRNVVAPDRTGRGPEPRPGSPAPPPPLAPLRSGPGRAGPAGDRPVFVDPAPGPRPPPARPELSAAEVLPSRTQLLVASPLLLGGMVAAGVVVIAALLLILGVL